MMRPRYGRGRRRDPCTNGRRRSASCCSATARAPGTWRTATAKKYGDAQVKIWRRSYDIRPPVLAEDDPRWPGHDPRYKDLAPEDIPLTECLKDTVARFLPYWHGTIAPAVEAGQQVIIAAHGNSLRALVKYLDNVSDDDLVELIARPAPEPARPAQVA